MTLEQLSDASNLSVSVISRLEAGERQPKLNHIEALAKGLHCDQRDLLAEKAGARVPIVGLIRFGWIVDAPESNQMNFGYVERQHDVDGQGYVAARIDDESSAPAYPRGAMLVFTRDFDAVNEAAIDNLALVGLANGKQRFGKLVRGRDAGRHDLIPIHPKATTRYGVELEWAAPISRMIYPAAPNHHRMLETG